MPKNAMCNVDSAVELGNALCDGYVGEWLEDSYDSEVMAIVLREDGYAILMLCDNNAEHTILAELQYEPEELHLLWDTMQRIGDWWQFYDKSIYMNLPHEKDRSMIKMFVADEGYVYRKILSEWEACVVAPDPRFPDYGISCQAFCHLGLFIYMELDPTTGEKLYNYSVTANEHTIDKFLAEMTARMELDEWTIDKTE